MKVLTVFPDACLRCQTERKQEECVGECIHCTRGHVEQIIILHMQVASWVGYVMYGFSCLLCLWETLSGSLQCHAFIIILLLSCIQD